MNWENIYTDLISAELGEYTGYVELFERDDVPGQYHWEILQDARLVIWGTTYTIEEAKVTVEKRLTLFNE